MPEIVSPSSHRTANPDGSFTLTSAAGPVYYKNDSGVWASVVPGSNTNLPGNCEYVPMANGYRIWKPAGVPPYNPAWLPTDYWLEVADEDDITEYTVLRTLIQEQAECPNQATRPTWKWTWSDNLNHTIEGGFHVWRSSDGTEQFRKQPPQAWSKANPEVVRTGTVTLDQDGYVTLDINLTGLAYPIIIDPTTAFNASTEDGNPYREGVPAWATARSNPADGFDTASLHRIWNDFQVGDLTFKCYRGMMPFDTSAISAAATITAATLTLYAAASGVSNADSISLNICQGTYDIPLVVGQFKSVTFVSGGAKTYASWADLDNDANIITMDGTGIAMITKGGTTKLAVCGSLDVAGDGSAPTGLNRIVAKSANHVDNKAPSLSVTYLESTGSPGSSGFLRGLY